MPQYKDFLDFLDKLSIKYEKHAKTATLVSFKVGGVAEIIVYPKSIEELCLILEQISKKKYKYFILCKGTNTYFTDNAYNGIIVSTQNLNNINIENEALIAECGASIFKCCEYAKEALLTGLEFAYGIPGGIGGALYMNASAYEKSISQIVLKSVVYDMISNKVLEIDVKEHKFNVKHSVFCNAQFVLLKTYLKLTKGKLCTINDEMQKNLSTRLLKQPCNIPNAGSAFKRPPNAYASRLIDQAGLKGFAIGGACISKLHAGFIVNCGGATARDINALIDYIYDTVKAKFNIELEREIIFVE